MLRVCSPLPRWTHAQARANFTMSFGANRAVHNLQPHTFYVLPGMTQWPTLLSIRRMPDKSARNFRTWKIPARINNPECSEHARRILTQRGRVTDVTQLVPVEPA